MMEQISPSKVKKIIHSYRQHTRDLLYYAQKTIKIDKVFPSLLRKKRNPPLLNLLIP
jgi:hypothetical protein